MDENRKLPPAPAAEPPGAALERDILADIPLARAMQLAVESYDGTSLTLAAPLAPNVNDKGCAFGGSLVSLMTLAGWGLVKLALDRHGKPCDIYVQDSDVRYLAPVWNDFVAIARLVDREIRSLAPNGNANPEGSGLGGADGRGGNAQGCPQQLTKHASLPLPSCP